MRIAAYEHNGKARLGIVEGETVLPVPDGTTLLDLLAATSDEREAVAQTARKGTKIPLSDVRLRAPIQPPTIRDFVTFEQHVEGAVKSGGPNAQIHPRWYDAPRFFWINPYSVVGPDDEVEAPPGCRALDFELELAAILGRAGRNLTPREAKGHIAGYTILNDWSARDLQAAEMPVGMGPSKGKDFATTLGPWIVTADELEPYRKGDRLDLRMTARINGEQLGEGDTAASMAWSFEDLVAHASAGSWVRPGDVIGSGTAGWGCLLELWGRQGRQEPPPLQPGDVIALEIEGIGTISNGVAATSLPQVEIPRARRLSECEAPKEHPPRIHHAGLSVGNLGHATDWYRRALGFEIEFPFELPGLRGAMLAGPNGTRIELLEREGSRGGIGGANPNDALLTRGWGHIALEVDGLEATYQRLLEAGAGEEWGPRPAPEPGVRMAFVHDPEGNLIELIERGGN